MFDADDLFAEVKGSPLVVAQAICLQPGDMTVYRFVITQTPTQKFTEEVTIALVDMRRHGAAFTWNLGELRHYWAEVREMDLGDQMSALPPFLIESINKQLGDLANPWTARACIEAVGRVFDWEDA